MSGAFDPYHRWLGISPKDQPPNHYRLLGIDLFESDLEVVRDAADRQMAHVRTYQLGPHVELSQQILNELATAKACLLDAEKKAAYDTSLRTHQQFAAKTSAGNAIFSLATPVQTDRSPHLPQLPPRAVSTRNRIAGSASLSKQSAFWRKYWIELTVSTAAVIVVIALAILFSGPQSVPTPEKPKHKQSDFVLITPDDEREDEDPVKKDAPQKTPARPLKLAKIADLTVDQGMPAQCAIVVADHGDVAGQLHFTLGPDAPTGAKIDPILGKFRWTPNEPGEYAIKVCASADGQENLGDTATFRVLVRNVVQPLGIRHIAQQIVNAGDSLTFRIRATNTSGATEHVKFQLIEPPSWVSIDADSGIVYCQPEKNQPPAQYSLTVRVESDSPDRRPAQKTFSIAVTPSKDAMAASMQENRTPLANITPPNHRKQKPVPGSSVITLPTFALALPSGKVLHSAEVDLRGAVLSEIDKLLSKCRNNSPDVVGFFQDGSGMTVASLASIKGKKPHGSAVFFHPGATYGNPMPKCLATYKNGKWDGMLATWDPAGQECFWGNYSNGQRNGLICLLKDNAVDAVLECTRNKIDAVHLIAGNRITKSFTDVEKAIADVAASPILKEIDAIEQELKTDNREFCDRVKQGIQMRVGAVNSQKRAAASARSAGRAAAQDATIHSLRKAAGY